MEVLKRKLKVYPRRIPEIPKYIWYFLKCVFVVKKPWQFIYAYLRVMPPPNKFVELRNGLKIYLSDDPNDVVTVFVIFIRNDYGKIAPQNVVIDIGANIGVFSLYAAQGGAAKVYAYEPNRQAFEFLLRNIQQNGLSAVIIPSRAAVTSVDGEQVKFPVNASVLNKIITEESSSEFELVDTISLETILSQFEKVDLLKLDCEGAEYDILLNSNGAMFDKVQAVRMEYHWGRTEQIEAFMQKCGLSTCHNRVDSATSGSLWFHKYNISLFEKNRFRMTV